MWSGPALAYLNLWMCNTRGACHQASSECARCESLFPSSLHELELLSVVNFIFLMAKSLYHLMVFRKTAT